MCLFQSLISAEETAECPLLILANKIDKDGAASEQEIIHYFNLHNRLTGKVQYEESFKIIEVAKLTIKIIYMCCFLEFTKILQHQETDRWQEIMELCSSCDDPDNPISCHILYLS